MKCSLVNYLVPEGPPYLASGATKAIYKCETHDWYSDGPIGINSTCPIGQIEAARDEAIEAVKREAAIHLKGT